MLQQLRIANENQEQLRAECMRYKEVLESRSSAVTVSSQPLIGNISTTSKFNFIPANFVMQ